MSVRQGNNIIAISNIAVDGQTIAGNSNNSLQSLGTVNKNQAQGALANVFDWIGTLSEYTTQDIENTHPEWVCYITDDGATVDGIYSSAQCDALFARTADVYTRSQANALLDTKANANNVYTKSEIDTFESSKANIDASNFTTTGTTFLSAQGMPSTRVDNLTVLVTDSEYTAPANGYFFAQATASSSGGNIRFEYPNSNIDGLLRTICWATSAGNYGLYLMCPIESNQKIKFGYANCTSIKLWFVYAVGNPGGQ